MFLTVLNCNIVLLIVSVLVCACFASEFCRAQRLLSWAKVHHLNRLAEGVQKELLLSFVVDPPIGTELDSPDCIYKHSIREVSLKRFIPNAEEKKLEDDI